MLFLQRPALASFSSRSAELELAELHFKSNCWLRKFRKTIGLYINFSTTSSYAKCCQTSFSAEVQRQVNLSLQFCKSTYVVVFLNKKWSICRDMAFQSKTLLFTEVLISSTRCEVTTANVFCTLTLGTCNSSLLIWSTALLRNLQNSERIFSEFQVHVIMNDNVNAPSDEVM